MKRKLLLFAVALLCSVGTWAQTWHDITSKITNPSFETGDMTGWTAIGESTTEPFTAGAYTKDSEDLAVFNANGGVAADGDYVYKYKQWWSNHVALYQSTPVTLPAGTYKIAANLQNKEEAGAAGNYELGYIKGSVSASNAPLTFTASTTGTFAEAMQGTTIEKEFTLSETTVVTFAAQSTVWGGHYFLADDFKLYSYGEDYTYKLSNADFESSPAASGNVSGYNTATSWTIQSASNGGSGIATYGAAYTVNSANMPSSPGSEYGNNGYMFRIAWGGNSYIYQEVTLPAGYYELGYSAQAIFANSKKTILKSTTGFYVPSTSKAYYGQVQDLSNTTMSYGHVGINLTEETTVQVRLGYQAQGYGSGNSTSVVFDNITLVRYDSEYQALAAANSSHPIDVSYKLGDALTAATWSYDDGTHTNWQTTKNVNDASGDYYWGSDNSTGDANYFEAYKSSAAAGRLFYQSINNVFAGSYAFRAAAMANVTTDGVVLYAGNGTTTVKPGTKVGKFFTVTGSISNYPLEIGLKQEAATANWCAIAQTGLFYNGATLSELKAQFNTLAAILSDDDYACVTGSERTAVSDIVNDTYEDDKAVYMEAIDDLTEAIATFKAAKSAYEKFDGEKDRAIAIGVSSGSIVRPVSGSASDLKTALQALYVQEDAAASSGYTVDATGIFGSWVQQNTASTSGQHWSGDGSINYIDKWNANGFTMSVTNTVTLPAGSYVFKAAARAAVGGVWDDALTMQVTGQTNAIFDPQGDSGKGIDTSGAANYGDGTYTNSGAGRGWEWRFIPFTLAEATSVTMKVEAIVKGGNWASFSDITLLTTSDNVAILKNLLNDEITAASAIDRVSNVGTGVFQTPSSAANALGDAIDDAQAVYDDGDAISSEVSTARSDLQDAVTTYKATINPPADGKKYYIKVATTDHTKENYAWLLASGATSDSNPTGYTIQANNAPAVYLCQAYTFTQVSGNTYKVSISRPEGEVYLTNGNKNGSTAGHKNYQIQATTDSEKAMAFKIEAADEANKFYIYNTETSSTIACQSGGNIYTEAGNAYFTVEEASEADVALNIEAGKYATRIFPFVPTLPEGVKAYSCNGAGGNVLTLVEVLTPAANVPYILENTGSDINTTLSGYGTASADSYTEGKLTGVYTAAEVPVNSYVLQTHEGVQAFYKVTESGKKSSAYRAYLTLPSEVKAFFFSFDGETGIIETTEKTEGTESLFDLSGRRVSKAQKGLYIMNGKKVMVK